jgi:hypothetical protein
MGQTSIFLSNAAAQSRITCPTCWNAFGLEQTLSIAEHQELHKDPVLGESTKPGENNLRFLPTRFTLGGDPIDVRGMVCRRVACPECRLPFPRQLLDCPPMFVSLLGNSYSGKSFYLTALTWTLRKMLGLRFGLALRDADLELNSLVTQRESLVFMHKEQDKPFILEDLIKKTQAMEADLVNTINRNGQLVNYLKPFFFMLGPGPKHPKAEKAGQLSRVVCFYDNAGEHFLSGEFTAAKEPLTKHLGQASFVLFVYDPTQDPRFRQRCRQDLNYAHMAAMKVDYRQELLVHEAANRYRKLTGLPGTAKLNRPLIVVLSKCDIWGHHIPELKHPFWKLKEGQPVAALDMRVVEAVSNRARNLLLQSTPELVDAAEAFAESVTYIPVSAVGTLPKMDPKTKQFILKPNEIKPKYVEVPFLYGLYRSVSGLVPIIRQKVVQP